MAEDHTETTARPLRPEPPALGRRAGSSMVWGQVAKSAEALLTLAVAVAVVRALNPNAFGLYSLLTYLAGSASVLIPILMVEAAGAVLPRVRRARERLALLMLIAGLRLGVIAVAVLMLLPGWEVVRGLFGLDAISYRVFVVGVVYWVGQDLVNSIAGFYLVELDLKPVALWRPVGQAVTLALIIYIATTEDRWSSSVGEVLAAVALGYLITVAGLLLGLRRYGRPTAVPRAPARAVLGLTPNTWVIGLLTFALATQIDVLLLGAMSNTKQVALYVAAVGIVGRAQALLLSGWLSPIIPSLSRAEIEGGRAGMARVWEIFAKLWLFVALPISALLLALAQPLVATLFGSAYEAAGGLVMWTAAFNIAVALAGGTLGTSALWALDRQRTVRGIRIVTGSLNIILSIALISEYAALGAVIATGIAMTTTAGAELAFAARYGGIRYPLGFALRVAPASIVAALPAILVRPDHAVSMVLAGLAGIVLYLVSLALVRPFTQDDLDVLARASPALARSPVRRLARR